MGIGDSITLVSCLAGIMAALPAFLIFLNVIFSRTTYRAARRLERGAILPFFAGLVPAIFIGVPVVGLISLGSVSQLLGVLGLLALLLWAFTGLAAVGRLAGERSRAYTDQPERPLVEIVLGSVALSFSIAFPIIGWLLVLPYSSGVSDASIIAPFLK
jgi:uncharacterized BrkB/YihY/UPF0761 family membrane protein